MPADVLIAQADITQLAADAVVYSTDPLFRGSGQLYSAFCAHIPDFAARLKQLRSISANRKTGDAYWIPIPGGRRPYGVVVVVSTGSGTDLGAPLAVTGALRCAALELNVLGIEGRKLVALPAFRLGYGGDRRQPLKSARLQLAAARDGLEEAPDLDVAFITYTPDHYQIYLEARRRLRAEDPARWDPPTDLEVPLELADAVRSGECVLFVGFGLSREAGLPGWSHLIERLASALGVSPEGREDLDYYLDLAQWYRESDLEAEQPLLDLVRETFDSDQAGALPTLAQYLLVSLPVRYVVTTNYDDLLERALRAIRRYPLTVVEQSEVAGTGRLHGVHVVKLHGDSRRGAGIVLSRDDYESFFRSRPAMASLLEGLLLNQTFLFAGYSLRDPDFRQIHHRVAAMLDEAKRPAFATTFDAESPHARRQWRRKRLELLCIPGEDQTRSLTRFLDRLSEAVAGRQHLFLASDAAESAAPLEDVRDSLRQTGKFIQEALAYENKSDLTVADLEQLEWTLVFLTQHGWRPEEDISLNRLWSRLAARSTTPEERQRRLVMALPHTPTLKDAQKILNELDAILRSRSTETPPADPKPEPSS